MPQKDKIIKLYNNEDYDTLKQILERYITCLNKNYKRGLGLCFDKEIFDVTMELYKRNGETGKADKLRRMVPDCHWEPVKIKNYRGEIIN